MDGESVCGSNGFVLVWGTEKFEFWSFCYLADKGKSKILNL